MNASMTCYRVKQKLHTETESLCVCLCVFNELYVVEEVNDSSEHKHN